MTEEQLQASGWQAYGTPQHGRRKWVKYLGGALENASAHVSPEANHWTGFAMRLLHNTTLRIMCDPATGSLAFCAHYAEAQARAIEAWLAGDEAAALEHARIAVAGPSVDPGSEEMR